MDTKATKMCRTLIEEVCVCTSFVFVLKLSINTKVHFMKFDVLVKIPLKNSKVKRNGVVKKTFVVKKRKKIRPATLCKLESYKYAGYAAE